MQARITEDELRLLVWLHENAKGFNDGSGFDPDEVSQALEVDDSTLYKLASYLSGHGLVGLKLANMTHFGSRGQESSIIFLWLTSLGEDYVRNIEAEPGIARRLTVSTLAEVKDLAVKTATTILTELVKQQLQRP